MSLPRLEPCPECGAYHGDRDVRARGLFRPQGPYYELAIPGRESETYTTREAAEAAVSVPHPTSRRGTP